MNTDILKILAIIFGMGFLIVLVIPYVFGEATPIAELALMLGLLIADDRRVWKR